MITLGAKEAGAARDAGIEQAASHRAVILSKAREIARELALSHGQTNADEVVTELELLSIDSAALGNAAGAIFRGNG